MLLRSVLFDTAHSSGTSWPRSLGSSHQHQNISWKTLGVLACSQKFNKSSFQIFQIARGRTPMCRVHWWGHENVPACSILTCDFQFHLAWTLFCRNVFIVDVGFFTAHSCLPSFVGHFFIINSIVLKLCFQYIPLSGHIQACPS